MTDKADKFEYLAWSIEARNRNQKNALKLLELFDKHKAKWNTKAYSRQAQELIAVSFSLWRAAFLAEKTGKRTEVFTHGNEFLAKIIEDNTISYPTDKTSKEWTFNYYTRNARYSLEYLAGRWPNLVTSYIPATRSAKERWDYCHQILDKAVDQFRAVMDKIDADKASKTAAAAAKSKRGRERKSNRAKVKNIARAQKHFEPVGQK